MNKLFKIVFATAMIIFALSCSSEQDNKNIKNDKEPKQEQKDVHKYEQKQETEQELKQEKEQEPEQELKQENGQEQQIGMSAINHPAENKIIEYPADDYLLLSEAEDEAPRYIDKAGNEIIQSGEYYMCFTDTFRNYAIVADDKKGYIAINRKNQFLFKIFVYDNGPDYVSEGLFRITKNKKIGYADAKTGKIVIKPIYQAAYPFENGIATVALTAKTIKDDEHYMWKSDNWIKINKKGKQVK